MVRRVCAWRVHRALPEDARVLVRAGVEAVNSEVILAAMRLVYCEHVLSPLLRPLVKTLFESVDALVHHAPA